MTRSVDWEAIEREYRAGQLSVREIARQHAISHVAVVKRAKRDGWTQNLAERVREAVTTKLVTAEVTAASSKEAIEVAATRAVSLVREHRDDIRRARGMVRTLLVELEEATVHSEEVAEDVKDETAKDKDGRRRARMLRAVGLPSRAMTMASLATSLKNVVSLERQAFNLDEPEPPADPPGPTTVNAIIKADEFFSDADLERLSNKELAALRKALGADGE